MSSSGDLESKKLGQIDGKTVGSRFSGKVAVITGSSEGIGYGIAYRLAQEGAHVVISSRRKDTVEDAVKKIKEAGFSASGVVVDVIKASDRKLLIEHALTVDDKKRIDVLISNVGKNVPGSILTTTSEEWDSLIDLNVKSGWELVKEAYSYIPKGGSIVFIGSGAGYVPGPPSSLYGMTKTLMFGLVAALSKELAPKGIRVNTLSAGPTWTPGMSRHKESSGLGETFVERLSSLNTLKRMGTIEEIGAAVAFLASDDAGYITGEQITATGGGLGARI